MHCAVASRAAMRDSVVAARLEAQGLDWIVPEWPAPPNVHAVSSTRNGGTAGEIDFSPRQPHIKVARSVLRRVVPADPLWLHQAHGSTVVSADTSYGHVPQADAAFARNAGMACVVLTADCLPVLFADRQ